MNDLDRMDRIVREGEIAREQGVGRAMNPYDRFGSRDYVAAGWWFTGYDMVKKGGNRDRKTRQTGM